MNLGDALSFLQGFLLLTLVFLAALTDLRRRMILNFPSLLAIVCGLLFGLLRGGFGAVTLDPLAQVSFLNAAAGGLAFSAPLFLAYLAGGMGAGDVKLAAGIGCLGGMNFALWTLAHTALAGAVLALILLVWQGEFRSGLRRLLRGLRRWRWREKDSEEVGKPLTLPYAVAILAGVLWTIWHYKACGMPLPLL